MVKILAFAGSGRKDSVNKKVVAIAAKGAQEAGAEVTIVNLEDFDMPIFNDWASRKTGDEAPMAAYRGKVAAIMAASPGALGGMRVLVTLRMLLENIGTMVLPTQKAVGGAFKLFDEHGNITDEKTEKALKTLGKELVETLTKLKG